ncbi:hypothetical protein Back11_07860 [Paenibacillus baekrokdamisoli]|uniref:Uncharacterized protein n=1 Tax=Paenibacillus baekrokdamisoli TaxID=1712516 RepID=A0A3G9J0N6_9BACL|nr:hypothetical protein Back11_07860 [Paenibacillus baekrokdamisoli]
MRVYRQSHLKILRPQMIRMGVSHEQVLHQPKIDVIPKDMMQCVWRKINFERIVNNG